MHSGPQLGLPKAGIGFLPEFLDFRRGIRVGNLENQERITPKLKQGRIKRDSLRSVGELAIPAAFDEP